MNDWEILFTDKTDPLDPTRGEFFWMRVLKSIAPLGLMKITIINVYPKLISITACDMLLPSDNYLLMLMLEVSLSLVYHVISETYVQFLIITSMFCMENCKRYLTVNRVVM